tara:strand:+ start:631 stop:981 length:351 start_codon:yes stop_codon:yes gene_type:complete
MSENIENADVTDVPYNPIKPLKNHAEEFWTNLSDPEQDMTTFVWLVGITVEIDESPHQTYITARSKEAAIGKICQILATPQLDFDVSDYTDAFELMKGYFDGSPNRDIFMMITPLE